ncbi:MAG: glycosyltransferase [Flavobacteriales bacterium]|nr:glycosyltransferase [Flavobacteriales bacterium]
MTVQKFRKLSILVAAYNEEDSLYGCVERVLRAPLPGELEREVIIVDDGSTDGTREVMDELAAMHPGLVKLLAHERNRGKGAAVRTAVAAMTGDLAIIQDADLEYDPREYGRLLMPIMDGRAEVVFGSRFAGAERKVLFFWHALFNRFITGASNLLNDTNWTDMLTCYKAFTGEALRTMPLVSNGFGIEPELAAKCALNKFRLFEVPISYNGRRYDEGKKIRWTDSIAILWAILRFRFSSNYSDPGKVTLDAIEQAPRFNEWMYRNVRPFLGDRVAELGCGRGNMSNYFRRHKQVLLTDYRDDYLDPLRERWGHIRRLQFAKLDMTLREDYTVLTRYAPESVVFLNVLEHIEDDRAVLRHLFDHVPSGCRLVVLVPFGMAYYSDFDRELGHFRRYSKGELDGKMREAGFEVVHQHYFNKAGKLAWFVANKVGRQKRITPFQLRVYNFLTPLFKVWDKVVPGTGLSTIVVCRRP